MKKAASSLFLISFAALLTLGLFAQAWKPASNAASAGPVLNLPAAISGPMKSISSERIRAHVKFLSSDLLEGRGTGQRGGDVAAEYMATQFALLGLKPAGDNGSYLQKVPLVGNTPLPETRFTIAPPRADAAPLRLLEDYVVHDETQQPTVDIDAPVVFVGYGIDAPEYNWNDYKDVDVRGKVLLMLVNEPQSNDPKFFKGEALTYYGRWTYKYEEGARKGAAGVLLIHKTDMASYGWEVVRNSWGGERSFLRDKPGPQLKAAGWVQLEVARRILTSAGQDLDALMQQAKSRDFRPVPLSLETHAHIVSKVRPFDSNNVIAELPGEGPRASEGVMYSAHYDHLGIDPSLKGDQIYNGAADNATGCGILLEMARAWSNVRPRPARSIYFASVTAEEQGLLGSEYLGLHPPIAANKISLDLNFDNIQPFGIPEQTEVDGSERTTFYPTVETVARSFGLEIKPDPRPQAGHYYRSDHFSMARVGIPAFSVNQGDKFRGHDLQWGAKEAEEYTAHRYHQPGDEYRADMDFRGDAQMAVFGFILGWKAASQPQLVQWLPGDEFEKARKP
jgi:Zn-dependent M28 family amino/carboxypeptidase